MTSCVERKVLISDLSNGKKVDSLRNSNKEDNLKPIAYKNISSEAIYNVEM